MENYEALGRYIAAKEQAEKFARERNTVLNELGRMISMTTGSSSSLYFAQDFDTAKAQELLNKAAEINQNLYVATQEGNNYAEACGKPKLQIYKRDY